MNEARGHGQERNRSARPSWVRPGSPRGPASRDAPSWGGARLARLTARGGGLRHWPGAAPASLPRPPSRLLGPPRPRRPQRSSRARTRGAARRGGAVVSVLLPREEAPSRGDPGRRPAGGREGRPWTRSRRPGGGACSPSGPAEGGLTGQLCRGGRGKWVAPRGARGPSRREPRCGPQRGAEPWRASLQPEEELRNLAEGLGQGRVVKTCLVGACCPERPWLVQREAALTPETAPPA